MPVFDERAAVVGEAPWWAGTAGTEYIDLGNREVTPIQLQEAIGLTWDVEKRPLFQHHEGRLERIPNRFSVTRVDTGLSLGLVSGRYEPFQNNHVFQFFQEVTSGLASGQVAGEFDGGRKVWLLAKLPETAYIAGHDRIDSYTLMANAHDGEFAFRMLHTRVRAVCRNTLAMALGGTKSGYKLSHYFTQKKAMSVDAAREALGLAGSIMSDFTAGAEKLAQTTISVEEIEGLLQRLFPLPSRKLLPAPAPMLLLPEPKREELMPEFNSLFRKRDVTRELIFNGVGNKGETRYDALNGVAEATDYVLGTDRTRAQQLLFGDGAALKQQAWDILSEEKLFGLE